MVFHDKNISVVIPSAGNGERMKNTSYKKQFICLRDKPVVVHTLESFDNLEYVNDIVLVVNEGDYEYCNGIIKEYNLNKVKKIVLGGKTRGESVYNGLKALSGSTDYVIIHDAVRPFVTKDIIYETLYQALIHQAAVCGVPVKDTVKIIDRDNHIEATPDRSLLWTIQTPQIFQYKIIMKAYKTARQSGLSASDDSMLVEKMGIRVRVVQGRYDNIKITTSEDLILSHYIMENQRG